MWYHGFDADFLAPLILGTVGGWVMSRFLLAAFSSRLGLWLLGGLLTFTILTALVRGYSYFFEEVTWNLARYIAENPAGFLGFVLGILLGLGRARRPGRDRDAGWVR